jgi:hypothetical protein
MPKQKPVWYDQQKRAGLFEREEVILKTPYRPRTLNATALHVLATAHNQYKRFAAGHCLIKLSREISPAQLTRLVSPKAQLARRSWNSVTVKHI